MVEFTGVWPQGLLDAYIAMIPKADGDSTPVEQRTLCVLPVVYRLWASLRLGHLQEWVQGWVPKSVFCLGFGVSSVEAWFSTALDIEEVLAQIGGDQLYVMVADVTKSFDTVDWSILDCALGRLGLPAWFRKVYFAYQSQVRLRFKSASGLGEPWCWGGGIPQGCPLSMVFIFPCMYVPRSFPQMKKVRHYLRTPGRHCLRTRARGRRQLMTCPWCLRRRRRSLSWRRLRRLTRLLRWSSMWSATGGGGGNSGTRRRSSSAGGSLRLMALSSATPSGDLRGTFLSPCDHAGQVPAVLVPVVQQSISSVFWDLAHSSTE